MGSRWCPSVVVSRAALRSAVLKLCPQSLLATQAVLQVFMPGHQVPHEALEGPGSRAHPSAALVTTSLPRPASREQFLSSNC